MKKIIAKLLCAAVLLTSMPISAEASFVKAANAVPKAAKLQQDDRQELNFNTNWLFIDEDDVKAQEIDYDETKAEAVSLPHSMGEYDLFFTDDADWQKVTWYRRHFTVPESEEGKRITVSFDGGGQINEVYVNGAFVGKAQGTFTHFSFDITDYVTCGAYDNVIAVRVDSRYHYDTLPPAENDFHWMGGLHGGASMCITDAMHLESVFYWTEKTGTATYQEGQPVLLKGKAEVKNAYDADYPVTVKVRLKDAEGREAAQGETVLQLDAQESKTAEIALTVEDPQLWDTDHPYLYEVETWLEADGARLDSIKEKTGLRWVYTNGKTEKNTALTAADDKQIFLNDKPLVLYGINKNQQFSYIGNSGTKKLYEKDAYTLKYDCGVNFVRTAHYENDPDFFRACDEIGLLVEEEALGWNTMPAAAREQFAYSVTEMIKRDRNHPSIILWSIMPNEGTEQNYPVAERQALAQAVKELDASRLTIQEEMYDNYTFVADVYANHDYVISTSAAPAKPIKRQPYVIGEWNDNLGRVFITPYDSEDRKIRQVTDDGKKLEYFMQDQTIDGIVKWDFNGYLTTINNNKWGKNIGVYRVSGTYGPFKDPLVRYWEADMMRVQTAPYVIGNAVKIMNEWKADSPSTVYVAANAAKVELFVEKATGEKISKGKITPNALTGMWQGLFRFDNVTWEAGSRLCAVSYDAAGAELGRDVRYASSYDVPQQAVYELTNATKNEYDSEHYRTYGQDFVKDNLNLQADGSDLAVLMGVLRDENGQKLDYAYENTTFEIVRGPGKLITGPRVYMLGGVNSCYLQSEYGKTGETAVRAKVDVGEMFNQDASAFTWSNSGWTTVSQKAYSYGGDYRKSSAANAWVEFSFTGTQAVLYAQLEASGYGTGTVTVDGKNAGKINFQKGENKAGATDMSFQPIFETDTLAYGAHMIRITADNASGIAIDAVKVFDGQADIVSEELVIRTEAMTEAEVDCQPDLPSAPEKEVVSAEMVQTFLTEAQGYQLEDYEAAGSLKLSQAMRLAERVLQEKTPSQAHLREAKNALQSAVNGLRYAKVRFDNKSTSDNEGGMSGFYRYSKNTGVWIDTLEELYANKQRTQGDFVSLSFEGTGIRLYGKKDANHGYADIILDGETVLHLDQYAATEQTNVLMYENMELENGVHQIKVMVTGQSSGNPNNACAGVCAAEVYKNGAGKQADLTALEQKLAEMRGKDLSAYPAQKRKTFEDALADAEFLLNHPLTSAEDIAEGVQELERAAEKLDHIEVESVEATTQALQMKKGESLTLTVKVLPADASNPALIFSSSDPAVVSVDAQGTVRALAAGSAKILIQSADVPEIQTAVAVTVTEKQEPPVEKPPVVQPPAKPAKPALTLKKSGKKKVTLKWKKVAGASGMEIWMKQGKKKFKRIKTLAAGKVKFSKKLKKGIVYKFKIRAFVRSGNTKIYGKYSKTRKVKLK